MKTRSEPKLGPALSTVLILELCRAAGAIATEGPEVPDARPPFWPDLQFDEASNPVFLDGGRSTEGELLFAVEIPKGETRKFELRTATGQVILDRVLCPRSIAGTDRVVHAYPVHYGIASGLFSVDGDPLDLLVAGNDAVYEAQIRADGKVVPRVVRVIGLLQMDECEDPPCTREEDWLRDWKVVAVDPGDPAYASTVELAELPDLAAELTLFFSNYKGSAGGYPRTRVVGCLGRRSAIEHLASFEVGSPVGREREIERCRALYRTLLRDAETILASGQPERNDAFLDCLPCVFSPEFFATERTYGFFIRYAAYQLLVGKLDQESVTLDTALERMESLKSRGKTHFRFVGYDVPEPGTGHAIFEWVKTSNRNAGCLADFPPQHYEAMPIAESWEALLAGGERPGGASPAPDDSLAYGELGNRLVERALARLIQRMELFHDGILPHEIKKSENDLRKQILYLRTHLDLFSFSFPMCGSVRASLVVDCGAGDLWAELRDDLDEGYERVGAFKDIYDGFSDDVARDEDVEVITLDDYRRVYEGSTESAQGGDGVEAEIDRERRRVDRWIRGFHLRLARYRAYLDFHRGLQRLPVPQLEDRRERTDLSSLYWGRVAVLPDPLLSGYDNVRQLAFVLLSEVANSELLRTVPGIADLLEDGERFHELRKRIRAVISLPELEELSGILGPEDLESASYTLLTELVDRYGQLNDLIVKYRAFERRWHAAASVEERRRWEQRMAAVRARIDGDWREVREWQTEAELRRHLIEVAVRFVRRRS